MKITEKIKEYAQDHTTIDHFFDLNKSQMKELFGENFEKHLYFFPDTISSYRYDLIFEEEGKLYYSEIFRQRSDDENKPYRFRNFTNEGYHEFDTDKIKQFINKRNKLKENINNFVLTESNKNILIAEMKKIDALLHHPLIRLKVLFFNY